MERLKEETAEQERKTTDLAAQVAREGGAIGCTGGGGKQREHHTPACLRMTCI